MNSTSGVGAASLLEGASNFRDFGACAAADGRRVRAGMLFRSNKLSALTPKDCAKLDAMGYSAALYARAGRRGDRLAAAREAVGKAVIVND